MKRKKKVAIVIFVIITISLFSLLIKWLQTGNPFQKETILYGTIVLTNLLITGSLAFIAFKKYSIQPTAELKKSLLPAFILFVLIALVISLTIVSLGVYIFYLIEGYDTSCFLRRLLQIELTGAIKQFSISILIGSIIFFYIIWRKAIDREQLLREENLNYKYRNLKAQVNPHFLFNSLNTLSELVYMDAKMADNYIQQLSAIYRYILENEDRDLIPLKDELDFISQYITLQKVRDQDKFIIDLDVNETDKFKVIPVSLQILVENAIKHNTMSREQPLVVTIKQIDDYIMISNRIQRKSILAASTQKGLSNLKERVRLIMQRELIIIDNEDQFIVKLPLIRL